MTLNKKIKTIDDISEKLNEKNLTVLDFKAYLFTKKAILEERRGQSKLLGALLNALEKIFGKITLGVTGAKLEKDIYRYFSQAKTPAPSHTSEEKTMKKNSKS